MAAASNPVDVRVYMRVFFSRAWWFLFVTLGVTAAVFYYSFVHADRIYEARNEIAVTDRYSGTLSKDIGRNPDWVDRTLKAEIEFKRPVRARAIITDAAEAVGVTLSEKEISSMVSSFKDEMKVRYSKKGDLMELSYRAGDAKLAAAVLSLFIKRMIDYCVSMQVDELNTEVTTLAALRARLESEVAAAERRLDRMKTVDPELRLSASTMHLLQMGKEISTTPTTEQAVHVFLQLQKDIIGLDSEIADTARRITALRAQIEVEPKAVPTQRRLESVPAVREAIKRRDQLKLQLAELLANSTAQHPMVKKLQTQIKSLDAFLRSAATQSTVEIVFEENRKREELVALLASLERDIEGLRERRAKLEENADKWRAKLERMPAELRELRQATLEYEKKAQNLSLVTDRLVQAQIKRRLELAQVGTYYQPQWDRTPIPSLYRKPRHFLHLAMGTVLGMITSVFVVYAMEFADHSIRDQRDLKLYTKAAVLGVISDYNQLKSVSVRAAKARAEAVKHYLLALVFAACVALLVWVGWKKWPRPNGRETLPESLSASTVANIEQAMSIYTGEVLDLTRYMGEEQAEVDVVPAVVTGEDAPEPLLSQ